MKKPQQVSWADRVSDLVVTSGENRRGWNPDINRQLGAPLYEALSAFSRCQCYKHSKKLLYDHVCC